MHDNSMQKANYNFMSIIHLQYINAPDMEIWSQAAKESIKPYKEASGERLLFESSLYLEDR